jgi:hypothetical protein
MVRHLIALIFVFGLAGYGCGKDKGGGSGANTLAGTCTETFTFGGTSRVSCLLYSGYTAALLSEVEEGCTSEEPAGVWKAESSCPEADLIGTCVLPTDGAPVGFSGKVTDFFYGPGYTVEIAESACLGSSGTFTAK